jgi:DNA-binding transcriptional LysR family regulator
VVEEERQFVEHLLFNGELHLALMLVSNLEDKLALDHETLVRSRNRVWIAPGHRFAAMDCVSFAEVVEEPLIALTIDEMLQGMRSWWRPHGLQPNIVLHTASVEAVRSLVATGAGVAVLPDLAYRPWSLEGDRLEARPLQEDLPTIDVGLAWRRGSKRSEATNTFLEVARDRG